MVVEVLSVFRIIKDNLNAPPDMNTEGERTQGQHRSEELPDMEAHALQSLNVGRESIAEHLREQQRAEEAEADLDREKILVRLADGACCGCGFTSVCTEPVIHEPSKVESLRKNTLFDAVSWVCVLYHCMTW